MQVVLAFVGSHLVSATVEREAAARDAIPEAAHDRADISTVPLVVFQPVEEQDEVAAHAAHRKAEPPQDGAIGEHLDLQAVRLAQRDGFDAAAILEQAEGTHHRRPSRAGFDQFLRHAEHEQQDADDDARPPGAQRAVEG